MKQTIKRTRLETTKVSGRDQRAKKQLMPLKVASQKMLPDSM